VVHARLVTPRVCPSSTAQSSPPGCGASDLAPPAASLGLAPTCMSHRVRKKRGNLSSRPSEQHQDPFLPHLQACAAHSYAREGLRPPGRLGAGQTWSSAIAALSTVPQQTARAQAVKRRTPCGTWATCQGQTPARLCLSAAAMRTRHWPPFRPHTRHGPAPGTARRCARRRRLSTAHARPGPPSPPAAPPAAPRTAAARLRGRALLKGRRCQTSDSQPCKHELTCSAQRGMHRPWRVANHLASRHALS